MRGKRVMAALVFWVAVLAGWLTHIVVAIQAKAWVFMIVGALLSPVAVVHGWSVWLGFDWLH
jgi:hypothetical protein